MDEVAAALLVAFFVLVAAGVPMGLHLAAVERRQARRAARCAERQARPHDQRPLLHPHPDLLTIAGAARRETPRPEHQ